MGLFWKKKKEGNIDEEIEDLNQDFSGNIPPPSAPSFVKKRLEEHPEDLIEPLEQEPSGAMHDDLEQEPPESQEMDKLFNKEQPSEDMQKEDIMQAVEEVKEKPGPEPAHVYFKPETVTMDDIEREFADPSIERPAAADLGVMPEVESLPEEPAMPPIEPELPHIEEEPVHVEEDLPSFDSPFNTDEESRILVSSHPTEVGTEIFIRLDDYQKIHPKVKELQASLNSTVRSLSSEVNTENLQLKALGDFNRALDHIQEILMEIDGLMFREE